MTGSETASSGITGNFALDWGILAVSLANIIVVGWLGLTVLLNSKRRDWGVWLIGGGLLADALFFIAHTAIIGLGFQVPVPTLNFWWRIGWVPLITLPLAWYISILWYVGFWEDRQSQLVRRQRYWFIGTSLLSVALVLLVLLTRTLPTFSVNAQLQANGSPTLFNIPLLFLLFPGCIFLCIGLSIDALRHPVPSSKLLGDQSRRLARPWLIGAAWTLLVVALIVGALMGWQLSTQSTDQFIASVAQFTQPIALLDLLISTLICMAAILVGQAIVRYEIFTGKALPRGELRRQWLNVVILAIGFSVTVSLSMTLRHATIYSVLLAALLVTLFYALLNWRAYRHRDAYLSHLRPWVSSLQIHDRLLHDSELSDGNDQFTNLCQDLLGTQRAYLGAVGSLAAFVRAPFQYPNVDATPSDIVSSLTEQFQSPSTIGLALDAVETDGYTWAIPLWSDRGLTGIFLLGPKVDGTLYTQEEIEIAQATGERLVDTQATSEIAHSLVQLQRNRLIESHVADQQTRRVLHDDVLPQLHSLLIELSSLDPLLEHSGHGSSPTETIADVHRQIAHLLHEMPVQAAPHIAQLGLVGALETVVAQEMTSAFDSVKWLLVPDVAIIEAKLRDSNLPISALEVIYYASREAMRNAARHGRGGDDKRGLVLTISVVVSDELTVAIEDNGVGIQHPSANQTSANQTSANQTSANQTSANQTSANQTSANQTTTIQSGASQGLALHGTMLAILGGTLEIKSEPDLFTQIRMQLPL